MSAATARTYDLESYWKDLTDPGQKREFLRLEPSSSCPVTIEAHGESGWIVDERAVADLSLGGVAIDLNAFEVRKVHVGESVRLLLTLIDRTYNVHARSVHISRFKRGLWPYYRVGLEFVGDASLQRALGDLVDTLHQLNREKGEAWRDIR